MSSLFFPLRRNQTRYDLIEVLSALWLLALKVQSFRCVVKVGIQHGWRKGRWGKL